MSETSRKKRSARGRGLSMIASCRLRVLIWSLRAEKTISRFLGSLEFWGARTLRVWGVRGRVEVP